MTDRGLAWTVAAVAFGALAIGCFFGVPDGKAHVGALRVLAGEIPYRDFWTMYAPGQFYATAVVLSATGGELAAPGLAASAVWAAATAAFLLLLLRWGVGRNAAVLAAAVFALMRWTAAPALGSYPPAFLMVLLAWHALVRALERDDPGLARKGDGGIARAGYARLGHAPGGSGARDLFRAGLWCGGAALFKHDVAAFGAAACAVAAFACERERAHGALCVAFGALLVVVPAALGLALAAGADAWQDLIAFPAGDFRLVRSEPYPPLWPALGPPRAWVALPGDLGRARAAASALGDFAWANVPVWAFAGGAVALVTRGRTLARATRGALLFALAGLFLFWLSAHVQQNTNVHSMAACALVIGGLAWRAAGRAARIALGALFAFFAAGLLVQPALSLALVVVDLDGARPLGMPDTAGVRVSGRDAELVPIARFVRANVPEDERIYVGLGRHDATVISDPIVYFLAGRLPCTRHHELHPGITDREDVQREIAASIEAADVRCAILWDFGWPKERLDRVRDLNAAAVPGAGSTFLDAWIAERFETVARHGEHRILWRRDAPRPWEGR